MTKPKTMWAVTSGSYSDYRVEAICATEEIAKEWVAKYEAAGGGRWRSEQHEVEEFPFVDATPHFYSEYRASGDTVDGLDNITVRVEATFTKPAKRPEVDIDQNPYRTFVRASCGDRNAAIKAVKDRLAALIASEVGK